MIEKDFFWNIRFVNTQKSFGRLTDLSMRHHYSFIGLMEPFQDLLELDQYKRKLGFENVMVNYSGKTWIFYSAITMKFCKNDSSYIISSVYVRCNVLDRLELWEEVESLATNIQVLWMVGGDFNIILNEEEKLGRLQFTQQEAIDFAQCINCCGLSEVTFTGSKYT